MRLGQRLGVSAERLLCWVVPGQLGRDLRRIVEGLDEPTLEATAAVWAARLGSAGEEDEECACGDRLCVKRLRHDG